MLKEEMLDDIVKYIKKSIKNNEFKNIKKVLVYLKKNNILLNDIDSLLILNEVDSLRNLIKENKDKLSTLNDENINSLLNAYKELNMEVFIPYTKTNNNDLDSTKYYINEISKYRILSKDEEVELFNRIRNNDKDAYDILVMHNLKLVIFFAKKYAKYGYSFDDLVQSGNIGLLRAIEKFDPSKERKFSTYASLWIIHSIIRDIQDNSKTIRVPVHVSEKKSKISIVTSRYESKYGREPSDEELIKLCNVTQNDLNNIRNNNNECVSLNYRIGDSKDEIQDLVEDDRYNEDDEVDKLYIESLMNVIEENPHLSEREKDILYMKYGVNYSRAYTLKEIGKKYNITGERARQILSVATNKCRYGFDVKKIKLEL